MIEVDTVAQQKKQKGWNLSEAADYIDEKGVEDFDNDANEHEKRGVTYEVSFKILHFLYTIEKTYFLNLNLS